MSAPERKNLDSYLPIPWRTYRGYILFFHVITLSGLGWALFLSVKAAWGAWRWQDGVVSLALVGQIGLYLGLLVFYRRYPWPRWLLPLYFGVSLAFWLVEVFLNPDYFWLGFMYLGQMFGMLPMLPALAGALIILLVILRQTIGRGVQELSLPELAGWLSSWVGILVLLLFLNHLIRTSRERARLIDELRQAHRELEAARQKEAELAVLRERERLARDMHDTLGHNLAALAVQLEAVQRLYRVDPAAASAVLDELKALTRGSMDELRRTLAGLRSPGLGERALPEALQALCADFNQRQAARASLSLEGQADHLPAPVAEVLWRSAQEALTNVEKHAAAGRVQLRLQIVAAEVCLQVEDDGRGFDPQSPPGAGHYGLAGMRERVEGIGGTLAVHGTPGGGARLEVHIPTLEKSI